MLRTINENNLHSERKVTNGEILANYNNYCTFVSPFPSPFCCLSKKQEAEHHASALITHRLIIIPVLTGNVNVIVVSPKFQPRHKKKVPETKTQLKPLHFFRCCFLCCCAVSDGATTWDGCVMRLLPLSLPPFSLSSLCLLKQSAQSIILLFCVSCQMPSMTSVAE